MLLMTGLELFICTIGMAIGVALPRVLPLTLLADKELSLTARTWLGFVPAAILAALVAPDIFLQEGSISLSTDNIFLLAAVPTLLVAWKTRSLLWTLAAGMACVAGLRWFLS